MQTISEKIRQQSPDERQAFIIKSFTDNYADLISGDTSAWRGKFRKMAESAFAFYRGSAALFYADVSQEQDPFLNEKTSRVWIQGDLHAENFGTYMNGAGVLVFDVNDFDEATVAPFTWDVKRFCASLALIGYQKALSDNEIRHILTVAAQGYARQISRFATSQDRNFVLNTSNAEGAILEVLRNGRQRTRVGLLDYETDIVEGDRQFKNNYNFIQLTDAEKMNVKAALMEYFETIPKRKRRSSLTYSIKDIARRKGLGIGSAGLLIISVLLEGETEALENDILISMKVALPSAASKYVNDPSVANYFKHEGHRTATSQRALQVNADPFLGYTNLDGVGMFVTEISPYTADLDWGDINDMDDILQVVDYLSRCIAKIHCVSDEDSDQTLIDYSTEDAIYEVLNGRESDFVDYIVRFSESYAECVRNDHRLFVDAFRNRLIPGL
ncbi:MAG TPA: DUF2252 domain-containing protein [Saprospiraceae bacterium]|nr:DUF2252 domain-containing protein [Saprospiraceae bacterium]HMQ81862.1 DUF2252 domain-containing protein [Saprospiraceae bacterium]